MGSVDGDPRTVCTGEALRALCCSWQPPLVGTCSWPHRAPGKFCGSASPEADAPHWRTASRFSPRGASRWPFLSSTPSLGCCCRTGTSSSGVSARLSRPRRCCGSTPGRSARYPSKPVARQPIQDLDNSRKVTVQQGILRDKSQPRRHLVTVVTYPATVTCRGVAQGLVLPRVRTFHVRSR
jgi:hypothetical protein